MERQDLKYWAAFGQFSKLGPRQFMKLYKHFENLHNAWMADRKTLLHIGIEENTIQQIMEQKPEIKPDAVLQELEKNNIKLLTISDEAYPKLLRQIYDPPPLLYIRGNISYSQYILAVVGTRKISPYGKDVVSNIISPLVHAGFTIVSGLALGTDTLAHMGTLQAQGKTYAVLGSGLDWDSIYPRYNLRLAQNIVESGGCLISEYPPHTSPLPHHFPLRNRIISGLSHGTLVIEAPSSSGALITAKCALEHNREVFAVPGSIFSNNSSGTNNLLKQGAIPVTCANDILEVFGIEESIIGERERASLPLDTTEKLILNYLASGPQPVDQLKKTSGLNISQFNAKLSLMEIKGLIQNIGGGMYRKIQSFDKQNKMLYGKN